MSSKNTTEVLIGGKIIRIAGYESEDYLQKVASYLTHKIDELKTLDGYNHMSADLKNSLLALNLADDYFKAKNKVNSFEEEAQAKDKEIYDLKHEIVNLKLKIENLSKHQSNHH